MTTSVRFCLPYDSFKLDFIAFLSGHYFNKKRKVVMDFVMTLHVCAKMLCNVWLYDFYDMTLSTEQQRRHMINIFLHVLNILSTVLFYLCF